jgi:metallo-beta-lactamase class B
LRSASASACGSRSAFTCAANAKILDPRDPLQRDADQLRIEQHRARQPRDEEARDRRFADAEGAVHEENHAGLSMRYSRPAMKRLVVAVLLAFPLFAQKDPLSRSWNQPVEPFRIAGNLYYVGASDITSYLITTPKGHIILDGGFEETVPMILANIRKLGFNVEDVKILLSSHAHYDHAGGLAELKRITGATFYASAEDIPQLARGGLDDPQFGNRFPFTPVFADRIIRDKSKVSLGGTTLTARITPGHTRGCTTWTMRAGGHDVVFVGSPSVPSDYRLTDNRRYPGAVSDYRTQFAILKSLPVDIFLASHGNFFDLEKKRAALGSDGKANPFVDSEGYHRFVELMERRFEERVRNEATSAPR